MDKRILTILTALTDRIHALETSQMRINEEELLRGAIYSRFFGLALIRGMGGAPFHCDALAYELPRQSRGRFRVTQPEDLLFQQFGPPYAGMRQPVRDAQSQPMLFVRAPLPTLNMIMHPCLRCNKLQHMN